MNLPILQDANKNLVMLETRWASILNPVIANPLNSSIILKNITLSAGSNTVSTTLGRNLQGYIVIGQNAASDIYDSQSTNPTPSTTLLLNSSAACTVNLLVF